MSQNEVRKTIICGCRDIHAFSVSEKLELRKRSLLPFQESVFEGLKHTYHIPGRLLGYSGHFDEDVIEKVRRHPDVSHSHLPEKIHELQYSLLSHSMRSHGTSYLETSACESSCSRAS